MIQLSNPVRLAVRQEFASQFNAQLALACAPLDLTPFEIDFTGPGNFWDGPIRLDFLLAFLEEKKTDVPALCLFAGPLLANGRPAVFDGRVFISGRVFLSFGDLDATDFESMPAAVQAAVAGILHESETDDWGGGTYNNDLQVVPGDVTYEDDGQFYRAIEFSMSFQVTAN